MSKGDLTVLEAGKRGGATRKAALGPEGYAKLGRIGGAATIARHGKEHFIAIGRKGGCAVRDAGCDYSALGKVGGARSKRKPAAHDD